MTSPDGGLFDRGHRSSRLIGPCAVLAVADVGTFCRLALLLVDRKQDATPPHGRHASTFSPETVTNTAKRRMNRAKVTFRHGHERCRSHDDF